MENKKPLFLSFILILLISAPVWGIIYYFLYDTSKDPIYAMSIVLAGAIGSTIGILWVRTIKIGDK